MLTVVLILQLATLGYHQVTTACDLFPFNDARSESPRDIVAECLINGLLMGLPPLGFVLGQAALMGLGLAVYALLLVMMVRIWWLPYWFGAGEAWLAVHRRQFARTIKLVPYRGPRHPQPDLNHTLLHLLTLMTFIVSAVYYFGR
ncbi:hypothetical protein QNA08_04895 [Chelatococcus sp. SYSU_G07232]|uniref:Uncharacterized protein n=1 Tax=Chelatococcus albus TaxID=3047466 RepID=A0ABT7ADV9_9HYPH|nr:hypothetical protein [Chelatococcus sp. SYSU_G07232]MDJ1157573.1 hypothetical protein [Chelatococcus sp. SYSU_G07232]